MTTVDAHRQPTFFKVPAMLEIISSKTILLPLSKEK
jgi:hypothetical protein